MRMFDDRHLIWCDCSSEKVKMLVPAKKFTSRSDCSSEKYMYLLYSGVRPHVPLPLLIYLLVRGYVTNDTALSRLYSSSSSPPLSAFFAVPLSAYWSPTSCSMLPLLGPRHACRLLGFASASPSPHEARVETK